MTPRCCGPPQQLRVDSDDDGTQRHKHGAIAGESTIPMARGRRSQAEWRMML